VKAPVALVVGASVLVSSPALLMVQAGTLTAGEALQRWAICLAACWLAITLIATLAFPDAGPQRRPVEGEQPDPEKAAADAP
jgi:hypothetical protein